MTAGSFPSNKCEDSQSPAPQGGAPQPDAQTKQQVNQLSHDVGQIKGTLAAYQQLLTGEQKGMFAATHAQQQQAERINTLASTYTYHGDSTGLAIPDEPQHQYYLHFDNVAARQLDVGMPNPTGELEAGTLLHVTNDGTVTTVRLNALDAQPIENASHYDITPNSFATLVLDNKKHWQVVQAGHLPDSKDDIVNRVIQQLQNEGKLAHLANKRQGGLKLFKNLPERNRFTQSPTNKPLLFKSLALVVSNADGEPELYYWNGNKADGTDGDWIEIDLGSAGKVTTAGIMLKDQTQDAAGITELTIAEGLELNVDEKDNTKALIRIAPKLFGSGTPSAYLAGLSRDKKIASGETVIFYDQPITPAGNGIVVTDDSYSIQDPTTNDPSVTGGTPTEILATVGFEGKAPEDGRIIFSVKVKPLGKAETYLTNPNGKLVTWARQVKQGDLLKPMFLAGIVQAKGLEYIRVVISHNFAMSELVIDHTKAFLCFQQLTGGWRSSIARNTFEQKAGISFSPMVEHLGANILSTVKEFQKEVPLKEGNAGAGWDDLDVIGLHNLTKVKAGIVGGLFTVTDNGKDIADFTVDLAADHHKTNMLRGHQVTFDCELVDKNAGWNFSLYAWKGEPDAFGDLYSSRTGGGGAIITNPNFVILGNTFVSEDVISGIHKISVSGTVPEDANNIVVFLVPVQPQQPLTIKVKDISMSTPPFTAYIESSPALASEQHLEFSESWARFIQNTQSFASLRYTYDKTERPAPTGIQFKGNAPITIDPSVNAIQGSQAQGGEGAYKFGFSGTISISVAVSVSNETRQDSTMNIFFRDIKPNGTLGDEIPDSRATFTVKAGDKNIEHSIPAFDLTVATGDRIAIRILESAADGAYLECDNDRQPLLETTFDIKALTP